MTTLFTMSGMIGNVAGGLSISRELNSASVLVALVLGLTMGMGFASLIFAIYFMRQKSLSQPRPRLDKPVHWSHRRRWRPPNWSGPCQWLAIRDSHPHIVQAALRLHNPTPCSWEEGLHAAHEQKLFISPPLGEWTLVMGASLPDPSEDVDACFHFIRHLSLKLGEVQFFSFNRPLHHHAWVRATDGLVTRAYAWADRTLWHQGSVTAAERELGLVCFDYAENPGRIPFGQANPLVANTERVSLLAARWSVNPTAIDLRFVKDGHGIAGRLSSSQPH